MNTVAGLVLALLAIGVVRAYINGGWGAVDYFWRTKLIGT